jgi:hypothetical protein
MTMRRLTRLGKRGILLISSYLVLSLFLVYSSAMTLRTSAQRLVSDHLRDRFHAMDLAQGALEQYRNDLYEFFREKVYQNRFAGDALSAMNWLDQLDDGGTPGDPAITTTGIGVVTSGNVKVNGLGIVTSKRQLTLNPGIGEAWVVDVSQVSGALGPRDVTIEATSTVNGITKRIQATYRFEMGMSDIFRYTYFVNNYGWWDLGGDSSIDINGEMRSNGDFKLSGNMNDMWVDGDIFASVNPELHTPGDPLGPTATGQIYGNPNEDDLDWYFNEKLPVVRPERRKSFDGQPTIGGGAAELLAYGQAWDTRDYEAASDDSEPEQQMFEGQSTQDIPYLGDLELYRSLAVEKGSWLQFAGPGPDGVYDTGDDTDVTIDAVHSSARSRAAAPSTPGATCTSSGTSITPIRRGGRRSSATALPGRSGT